VEEKGLALHPKNKEKTGDVRAVFTEWDPVQGKYG